MEFNVKKVAVCRVAIIPNEVLHQIYFLGIYKIFNMGIFKKTLSPTHRNVQPCQL